MTKTLQMTMCRLRGLCFFLVAVVAVVAVVAAQAVPSASAPPTLEPRPCNVVLTGSSGFLGQHLLRTFPPELLRHITVLGRPRKDATRRKKWASPQPQFLDLDLAVADVEAQYAEAMRAVRAADVVVHAAGVMSFFPSDGNQADPPTTAAPPQEPQSPIARGSRAYMERVNVNGTRVIAHNMRAGATLVYVSSTEAMGACTDCTEDDNQAQPWCAYGRSKRAAETHVRQATRQRNASHVILRMTGLMGPEDSFSLYQLMLAVHLGLLPFTVEAGSARLMYTHVEDAVYAIRLSMAAAAAKTKCALPNLLESTASSTAATSSSFSPSPPFLRSLSQWEAALDETFLIGPPNALSVREWITAIARALGRPVPFMQLPRPLVRALMGLLDPLLNAMVRDPFLFKPEMVDRMLENRTYSSAKARRLLGYSPRYTCQHAVAATAAWYLQQGWFTPTPISAVEAVLSLLIAVFVLVMCGSRSPAPLPHVKTS